jgi:hypothetical protein
MKYFTREWRDSESDTHNAAGAYARRLKLVLPALPADCAKLDSSVDLHDAVFQEVSLSEAGAAIAFTLVVGDNSRGYSEIVLKYWDTPETMTALFDQMRAAQVRELLYDELDVESGRFVHRFVGFPECECTIEFTEFDFERTRLVASHTAKRKTVYRVL